MKLPQETPPPVEVYMTMRAFADAAQELAGLAIRSDAGLIAQQLAGDLTFGEHGISVILRGEGDPPLTKEMPQLLVRAAHLGNDMAYTSSPNVLGKSDIIEIEPGEWAAERLGKAFGEAVEEPARLHATAKGREEGVLRLGVGGAAGTSALIGFGLGQPIVGVVAGAALAAAYTVERRIVGRRDARQLNELYERFNGKLGELFVVVPRTGEHSRES